MYYVIQFLIILLVLIQLLWFLYKRKFKELNNIPGPKDFPIIGNLLDIGLDTVAQWQTFLKISRIYKPFVKIWLGPYCYFATTDPNFTKHLLSSLNYTKKSIDYEIFRPWLKNGLLLNTGKSWQARRKMITPAFNFKIMEHYSIVFNKKTDCLIEELSKHVNNDEFDVYPYITKCTVDVICETAMGITLADRELSKLYVEGIDRTRKIVISRLYSLWKRFDILFKLSSDYQIQKQLVKDGYDFTSAIIHERRRILQETNESNDSNINKKKKQVFLDTLLNGTIDGMPLSHDEIQEEVQSFMVAGHDTTASFLSFAMYALSREPDIQEKMYDEIRQIFGSNKNYQPTLHEMNEMKYTERVLKEVQRLYPSIPFIGRHLEEDLYYKDMVIPKDTMILIVIYCMHRREDLFPDPEKFDPDRFLSKELIDEYSYIPFSAGIKNCIGIYASISIYSIISVYILGQKYAMYEVKCAISKLIMNFKILPADPKNAVQLSPEIILKSRNGVHIKLINRTFTK